MRAKKLATELLALILLFPNLIHADGVNNPKNQFSNMEVIPLVNGPNHVDINGDGKQDIIFMAWRGNHNAHGFSIFAFYINSPDENEPEKQWHLVPFPDEKGIPVKNAMSTSEGADCLLQDIRVLRSKSHKNTPVTVVVGGREFGESFADSAPVKFVVYELVRGSMAGEPPFSFVQKKTIKGKKKYCDINAAFLEELGLRDYQKRAMDE